LKVTEPEGVPEPGAAAVTVAVKLTVWPVADGFGAEVSVVTLPSWCTVCTSTLDVLPVKFTSPAYTTLIESLPTARAEVVKVAWPPESVPVPRVATPFLKVTAPVGVPEPGAPALTVAVKVTDWPKTEGLAEDDTVVTLESTVTVWLTAAEVLEP
jgi:hypothetical protein